MMQRMMLWVKGDSLMSAENAGKEFKNRYRRGLFLFLIPMAMFFLVNWLIASQRVDSLIFSLMSVVSFFVLFFYALVYYRCPRCGTTPTSSRPGTTGVLLFPKICSKCKAPLLPDHRWAQE
jgi:amino acid permease